MDRTARDGDPRGSTEGHKTRFDLHIVRWGLTETLTRTKVKHLYESEQKLTGFVFVLAGYFVQDVPEAMPFILLDSLEAIDSTRIARAVGYFRGHAD